MRKVGLPYSEDLRERVRARLERGEKKAAIARDLQLSVSTVQRYSKRLRVNGNVKADVMGGYRWSLLNREQILEVASTGIRVADCVFRMFNLLSTCS